MSDNLQSLIKLLIIEDDPKIIEHVSNELVKKGHSIIDTLQTVADTHNQVAVSDIIEDIIHRIHCRQLHTDLKHWATFRDDDLLEGLLLVASFQYPFLEVSIVKERLAELQRCATDDVLPTCATTKAISILSNNIYGRFEYKVAPEQDCSHDVRLYYINDMLSRRKTSPTLMAAIYYLCSSQLNIPTLFIDTPDALTLGFGQRVVKRKVEKTYQPKQNNGIKIDCYLNIDKGTIEAVKSFQNQLEESGIYDYLEALIPVDNKRVIQRLLEELAQIYKNSRNRVRYRELRHLATVLN